jgi:cysteinyl-tRNA synthetase
MGFPGWHLECSVMSTKYLGRTIDIHGGGLENQFPHHDCEIAQSEAANGVPFVRTWLHNNMVTVDGQKMGKSLNNFITLKQAFAGEHERLSRSYDPLAVRQLILNSHYRSPLDFSDAALHAAQSGYEKIAGTAGLIKIKQHAYNPSGPLDNKIVHELKQLKDKFEKAMNDDLNTAIALSVMFDLVRLGNKLLGNSDTTKQTLDAVDHLFHKLGGEVLGIVKESDIKEQADPVTKLKLFGIVKAFIDCRNQARKEKSFILSDAIRDVLTSRNITLEDKPDGTTSWRMK